MQFSKEELDERAAEEKSDHMGSIFRGPQGLFPQLDGYVNCFVSVRVVILMFFFLVNTCLGSSS